jgi:predicted ATPase
MPDERPSFLMQHLRPRNFLSFGPDDPGIELRALNLFIGPNGSGKSNLVEAINLMRFAPRDFRDVTRKGGGVAEWIWKGRSDDPASVECVFRHPERSLPLRHGISFRPVAQAFALEGERIEDVAPRDGTSPQVPTHYGYVRGREVLISVRGATRQWAADMLEPDRSILAQRRDPDTYPELAWLAQTYERIRIYREWGFGRGAVFREPQKADLRSDLLEEDFSNLGLFLSRLKRRSPAAKKAVLDGLKDLYEEINDFDVSVEGGTVQVFFTEGDYSIPATRLSDGTLRYLCLLAILCDPEPPPLVCIEEPELGLHPDVMPKIADLLVAASQRMQLLVTTHSDILVDAMTERPEVVVVCEKHDGRTSMERLNREALVDWLDRYRLGQLWTKGQIGGTRW